MAKREPLESIVRELDAPVESRAALQRKLSKSSWCRRRSKSKGSWMNWWICPCREFGNGHCSEWLRLQHQEGLSTSANAEIDTRASQATRTRE